jgi:hypothetical protein
MKKILLIISIVTVIAFTSSCSSARNLEYSFDANGNYTGFKTIPDDYTPEQAEKDGCYISKNLQEIGGEKAWIKFVKNATRGKDSSVRIMSIYDDGIYFEDLFFNDGSYQIFDSSSEDLKIHKYKYLLDLKGRSPNAVKDGRFVVLTDDKTLTFEKVSLSLFSSSMNVINSISSYKMVSGMGY